MPAQFRENEECWRPRLPTRARRLRLRAGVLAFVAECITSERGKTGRRRGRHVDAKSHHAAAMNDAVRTALTNLQGLLDEGFVSKAEYTQRRKAIIDGATDLPANSKPASDKSGKKGSVFDRLGSEQGGGGDGAWDHSGFTELYGAGRGGKAAGKGRNPRAAPYQTPAQRSVTITGKGSIKKGGGDLRSKIRKGGADLRQQIGAKPPTGKRGLPEKCPW